MRLATLSLATCLLAGTAVAQQQPQSTVAPPNTTSSDSHNPAVAATSNANDQALPAKGSNSFTESQAKSRIAERGYSSVSELKEDNDGVWRGIAHRNGQPVQV